jgi:hypothetical protein
MASFHDRAMTNPKAVITDAFGGRLVRNNLSLHLLGSGAEVDQPKNKTTVLNPDLYIFSAYGLTLEEKNNPE